ncbi:hypothetical protein SAMN06265371_102305 [Lutibacter agarilyticus]|uniref:Lipoprotein n=1 Tax=Lutibacter agarilyticus TaxID=1109740 RepID=A0A238W051_9FLAO|nr:hypothetical protein [Lutibacter agarilyticus]SNR39975.1 hypothetical protein SAMN06265371_102305 [Lutibacter agarilyticus]
MKTLKKTSIGIAVIGLLLFISCGSTSKISENNPPFKVLSATYTEWLGGQPGVNGVLVSIKIDNLAIKLDSVYFRNTSALLKLNKKTTSYNVSIVLPNTNKNLQLDIDPRKEFGNEVPDISTKIPFELNDNEAVVSYLQKGKTNYYKISSLIEIKKEKRK